MIAALACAAMAGAADLPWAEARAFFGDVASVRGWHLGAGRVVLLAALVGLGALSAGLGPARRANEGRAEPSRLAVEMVLSVVGVVGLVGVLVELEDIRRTSDLARATDGFVTAVPGIGLWVALGAALALVATGVWALFGRRATAAVAGGEAQAAGGGSSGGTEDHTPPRGAPVMRRPPGRTGRPDEALPGAPAPGWYPDPSARRRLRWWDGQAWSEHVSAD